MAKVIGLNVGATSARATTLLNVPLESITPLDDEIQLLTPAEDINDPEVSIVIPAMDERITIEDFVEWCKAGLAEAGVKGEILIVDSSSDETADLALARGARVLRTRPRGLGQAYIDAIP